MIKNFLNESITSVVFRLEPLTNFLNTLKDNKFYTSLSQGNYNEKLNDNKLYYLSTSRTRNNRFTKLLGDKGAIMTLDGTKFNHNFKGKPVDYWQYGPENSESEDRILTDKNYIDNAISYIKSVDILFSKRFAEHHQTDLRNLKEITEILTKNNIPFYVFENEQDFRVSNKSKAKKDLGQFFSEISPETDEDRTYLEDRQAYISKKAELFAASLKIAKLYISGILEKKDNEEKMQEILNSFAPEEQQTIRYFFDKDDAAWQSYNGMERIRNMINSEKTTKEYTNCINDFLIFLKKLGIKGFRDLAIRLNKAIQN